MNSWLLSSSIRRWAAAGSGSYSSESCSQLIGQSVSALVLLLGSSLLILFCWSSTEGMGVDLRRLPLRTAILGASNARSDSYGGKVSGRFALRDFGVVFFSNQSPWEIARLADRIVREVPGARVGGILYEQCPPRTLAGNLGGPWRNLRAPPY